MERKKERCAVQVYHVFISLQSISVNYCRTKIIKNNNNNKQHILAKL